ncbi:MAG: outer membrane lipoprotein carrier protein LolA [Planctomycetota bacterium]
MTTRIVSLLNADAARRLWSLGLLSCLGVAGCSAGPAESSTDSNDTSPHSPVVPQPVEPAAPAAPGAGLLEPVVVEPAPMTAEGWLTVLEASASQTESLTARVRMTNVAALLEEETQYFGSLRYAAADDEHASMRFAVRFERKKVDSVIEDIDQSYVYDGRWLLDVDAKDQTATRRELVPEGEQADLELGDGPFLLPLNLRKDRVLQKFEVGLIEPAEDDPKSEAGTFHLRLIPKPQAGTDAQQIDLWFDQETLLPLRAATLEADDDQTIVDLFRPEANASLEDEAFDTALPDGRGWELQVVPLD